MSKRRVQAACALWVDSHVYSAVRAVPAQSRLCRQRKFVSSDSASIGGDPNRHDRFADFPSDSDVRAAGFALIEPSYVGPSWEKYIGVFRPEGGKRSMHPDNRRQVVR